MTLPIWKVYRVGVDLAIEITGWVPVNLAMNGALMVTGPFYLVPELKRLRRPLDPPCPAFPETLQQHRWAALHDVSERGPARVLVEMDKLMQRGWSAAKAWREVVYQHRRRGAGRPSWMMWVSGQDDPSKFRNWNFLSGYRRPAFSASWHEPMPRKRGT